LQPLQLRKSLEEKNVNYSSKYRYGQVQGCFYCVKFRNDDDDSVIDKNDSVIDAEYMKVKDHEAIIDNITKEHDKKYDDMRLDLDNTMEYVEKLKAYIEELKKKPTIKPEEKKPKKKATIKPEEIEPVEDDLFKQIDNNKFLDKKTKKIYKVYNNNEEINFDGNLF
jgi:hypothetical protein